MRWTSRLTQPEFKQAKTFEPLRWETIGWLVVLFAVYTLAGFVLSVGQLPITIVLFALFSTIALAWLKTYSWLSDTQQTLADFFMPLAGILATLIGSCVPTLLGMAKMSNPWTESIVLLGLLPATAAFRGGIGVSNWIQSLQIKLLQAKRPKQRLLHWLPASLFGSIVICVLIYYCSTVTTLTPWVLQGLAMGVLALPTAAYLYLAYSLMPNLIGEQMEEVLQQFSSIPLFKDLLDRQKQESQTLDIDAIEIQPPALPANQDPANPQIPNSKDAAKQKSQSLLSQSIWQTQILLPAAIVIIGSVLVSYLYWKINQWLGAVVVFGLDLGLPSEISVNWGWDWFKGWIFAWVVAVVVAVLRVAKQMRLWPSLLSTLSMIGGALLIPTALIWGLRSGWPAMAATAWATLLGISLSQASWHLEKTVKAKSSVFVLTIISTLGLGLGRLLGG
jgi:hypothetical protein